MHSKSTDIKRRVKLENLFDEKIIIEDSAEYEESVFAPIYQKANNLVKTIKDISKEKENDERRQEELQIVNTISFEGRRGTGKTSAMMSYCNQLNKRKEEGKREFIVLDYIDASTLEAGESVLEIVLANIYHMLSEFMEKHGKTAQYDYETRNIIRKLEEIYSGISSIKKGRRVDLSPLSGLERLSNSQQLKKDIYDLICKFTKHIASEDAMLVIPIDDIDMCFQGEEPSVYEVMETLHRYLMIPNVVIFLTYDYPELLSGCEKHFSQMLYYLEKNQRNRIKKVSNRYLEKVLPTYARIHMPSQRKRDYSDQNIIQVCLKQQETEKYLKSFKNLEKSDDGTVNLNPKQFALLFKASNWGLFYDSQGKKRHYAEPSNFRDMVHIVTMCKQLCDEFNQDTEDGDEIIYKELLDDLYFRFARINLIEQEEEYDQYNEYLKVNIERRSKDILSDIWKKLAELERGHEYKDGYSKIEYIAADRKVYNANISYSYGELLYGLYRASSNGVFSKALIWCILDSYTIMLTKLYRAVKRKERYFLEELTENGKKRALSDEEKEKAIIDALRNDEQYNSIKSIIGPSISSSWSNYYVPQIINHESGKYSSAPTDGVGIVPNEPKVFKVGAIKFINSNVNYNNPFRWRLEIDPDDDRKDILQTIEILCMFFTDVKGGFLIDYSNGDDEDIPGYEEDRFIGFTFKFFGGCFNIMNFVNNLFWGEEFFSGLHEKLKYLLDDFLVLEETPKEKWLRENSLYKRFQSWKDEFGRCAMPIYSFDMMYNIMKRQYLHTIETNPYIYDEEVTREEFLKRLLKVYSELQEALDKQDIFYYLKKDNVDIHEKNNNIPSFATAFAKCPFIEYMSEIEKAINDNPDDKRIKYLQRFFHDISILNRL